MTPLILLDVDGVVNALPDTGEDLQVWPDWQSGWAIADGTRFHITYSPTVIRTLRGWHESGTAEIHWLTTWGHDANDELRELLELPELVVAGTYDAPIPAANTSAASHSDVAPAAPDPLTGRWWKYDIVQRVLLENPGRVVIWIDDELHGRSRFRSWADTHNAVVPIGPNPRCGLRAADLATVEAALASGAAETR